MKLARVGMTMEEATIVRWCKAPLETFAAGDPLYEFETEKVSQEVVAAFDGRLLEIRAPQGSVIEVGGIVCTVESSADGAA